MTSVITATVFIKKINGERELWDDAKLRHSLIRSGAKEDIVEMIVEKISSKIKEDMTTSDIYRHAFTMLHKMEDRPVAARYSLRRAVMALGPSGFPFEKYLAELLKIKGFETETGVMLRGGCAEHEIDVIAKNDSKLIVIEAKFHNETTLRSDLKVALYVRARLDDLRKTGFAGRKPDALADEGWIVTNTKFTSHAINYAQCAGLTLLSWNYPQAGNLQDLIEEVGLHPLTCLTTLSAGEKVALMQNGVVLCRAAGDEGVLRAAGVDDSKIQHVQHEVNLLCPII